MTKSISQILNAPVLAPLKKNVFKIKSDFLKESLASMPSSNAGLIYRSDLDSQNRILNRAAISGNTDALYDIFKKRENKDLKTYSIMIKGLTAAKDLKGAFEIYQEMKNVGIQPNQIVYTSLIKGCLNNRQVQRAWKTWDFMRSHISEPDYKSYSLMIHACTYTGEVEKAFGLFEEMKEKGLEITPTTLCSLIQVCGSRKDYYLESFNLFDQLKDSGVKPNLYIFNTLLSVTSREGDYPRAFAIWKELTTNQEVELNEHSFSMIFKTLARGLAKLRNEIKYGSSTLKSTDDAIQSLSNNDVDDLNLVDCEKSSESKNANDDQNSHNNLISNLENDQTRTANPLEDTRYIYEKAIEIWTMLNKQYPSLINNHILDTYLKVLCSVPVTNESFERALNFYRKNYTQCPESSKGQGYLSLLGYVIKSPDVFKEHGPALWREFLDWDNAQESKLTKCLTEMEKEEIRVSENRDRDSIFTAFIWMVRGHTRAGDTDEALEILKSCQSFRSLDYLRPIFFRDIWVLVKRARDQSEDGKWTLAQELSEICSNTNTDPLQAVQKSMKQRLMPQNWWGWKAVGLDEIELKRLQKKNNRIKHKVHQASGFVKKSGKKNIRI